jgi:hypothetical protein
MPQSEMRHNLTKTTPNSSSSIRPAKSLSYWRFRQVGASRWKPCRNNTNCAVHRQQRISRKFNFRTHHVTRTSRVTVLTFRTCSLSGKSCSFKQNTCLAGEASKAFQVLELDYVNGPRLSSNFALANASRAVVPCGRPKNPPAVNPEYSQLRTVGSRPRKAVRMTAHLSDYLSP